VVDLIVGFNSINCISGHIKLSDTNFNAFLQLEKRKEDKQKANNKPAADQSKENDANDRKSAKPKKKKTVSPNESPKSNKPQDFETMAKEVCFEFISVI